jgi:hypothetical protein
MKTRSSTTYSRVKISKMLVITWRIFLKKNSKKFILCTSLIVWSSWSTTPNGRICNTEQFQRPFCLLFPEDKWQWRCSPPQKGLHRSTKGHVFQSGSTWARTKWSRWSSGTTSVRCLRGTPMIGCVAGGPRQIPTRKRIHNHSKKENPEFGTH